MHSFLFRPSSFRAFANIRITRLDNLHCDVRLLVFLFFCSQRRTENEIVNASLVADCASSRSCSGSCQFCCGSGRTFVSHPAFPHLLTPFFLLTEYHVSCYYDISRRHELRSCKRLAKPNRAAVNVGLHLCRRGQQSPGYHLNYYNGRLHYRPASSHRLLKLIDEWYRFRKLHFDDLDISFPSSHGYPER